MHGHTLGLY